VTLLKDFAGAKVGSTIRLGPSTINIGNGGPSNAIPVGGFAYGGAVKVGGKDAHVAVRRSRCCTSRRSAPEASSSPTAPPTWTFPRAP
jgi:hypothetical protein